ncbi:MAG: cysteine hydrolase [Microthrixaceae bacterium]
MPQSLPAIETTALITMELQQGVVGDCSSMTALRDAALNEGTLQNCGLLAHAARRAGVVVIHAVVSWRADRTGTALNTPLVASLAQNPDQILEGTRAVELIPELGDTSADLLSHRRTGLTPFTCTDLDATLRSLGVQTLVPCGVSLNIGVLGLCLSASDLGYDLVLCSDASVGLPVTYGELIFKNTLAMLGTVTTTDALLEHWSR